MQSVRKHSKSPTRYQKVEYYKATTPVKNRSYSPPKYLPKIERSKVQVSRVSSHGALSHESKQSVEYLHERVRSEMKHERNKIYLNHQQEKLKMVRRKQYGQVVKELASLGPSGDIYKEVGVIESGR